MSRATLSWFALTHSLLRLAKLLTQLLQPLRYLVLGTVRIRIDAAAQPVGRPLHMIVEVGLVHFGQRISQLLRDTGLVRSHLTRSIANTLLQLRQIVGELLPLAG